MSTPSTDPLSTLLRAAIKKAKNASTRRLLRALLKHGTLTHGTATPPASSKEQPATYVA
jgi:hypothetical protein